MPEISFKTASGEILDLLRSKNTLAPNLKVVDPTFSLYNTYCVPSHEPCLISRRVLKRIAKITFMQPSQWDKTGHDLLKYVEGLMVVVGGYFKFEHASNTANIEPELLELLEGDRPILALTCSSATLDALTKMIAENNELRCLILESWEYDPYRDIKFLHPSYQNATFELVLLDPARFRGWELSVRDRATGKDKDYVGCDDGSFQKSPGNPNCSRMPPFSPFKQRPHPVFEINPFLVALSAARTFERCFPNHGAVADPFSDLPEYTRSLIKKTMELKKVLEWKLRDQDGNIPLRYAGCGSGRSSPVGRRVVKPRAEREEVMAMMEEGQNFKVAEQDVPLFEDSPVNGCDEKSKLKSG